MEIVTNHSALQYFGTKQKLSEQQIHWIEYLSEYDYTIQHKPEKEAVIPDALSRRPDYKHKVNNEYIMIPKEQIQDIPLKTKKINDELTAKKLQNHV